MKYKEKLYAQVTPAKRNGGYVTLKIDCKKERQKCLSCMNSNNEGWNGGRVEMNVQRNDL